MPAVAYPTGVWIPKGGVKHPNAAKLFLAWMLTPEGKKAVVSAGRGRLAPAGASLTAKWLADNGIDLVRIESKEDIRIYNQDFAKTVMTLMGLMPK